MNKPSCVKALRLLRGLTLDELSSLSGVSAKRLSQIEADQDDPTPWESIRLSQALNVCGDDLFRGDDE